MTMIAMQPVKVRSYPRGSRPVEDGVAEAVEVVEMDGPVVRWERILALRGQIAAGTYRVASAAIAEKMIDAMMR